MARQQQHRPGGTPATVVLDRAGITYRTRVYEHDPSAASFGLEAAEALGEDPDRVLKTLLVEVDSGLAVGVVPVSRQLDLKAVAAAFGSKRAGMADRRVAERSTGYVVGGISPIGQRKALPSVIDVSARDHDTVLVSGGKRGFDLELSPHDLAALVGATFAAIAR